MVVPHSTYHDVDFGRAQLPIMAVREMPLWRIILRPIWN